MVTDAFHDCQEGILVIYRTDDGLVQPQALEGYYKGGDCHRRHLVS